MKKTILTILPLLLIVGCSKPEPINYETTLFKIDGVFYTQDTNEPYSGAVFSLYTINQKKEEGILKDGKKNGIWIYWNKIGQKIEEKFYRNGNQFETAEFEYHNNGQKSSEITYTGKKGTRLFGMDMGLDGKYIFWYENGQKKLEGTYKDGKKQGLYTWWYENGQKKLEGTYKNGEFDGLETEWYENGQKSREGTYKDGQLISEECWDENGNNQNCYEMPMGGEPFIENINLPHTKYLFENGVVFVDTRTEELFIEGHIKNALNSDSFEELIFKIESLQTKDVAVVIYCGDDECGSSEELAYDLSDEGFTKLFILWGGLEAWNEAGYPTENQ